MGSFGKNSSTKIGGRQGNETRYPEPKVMFNLKL